MSIMQALHRLRQLDQYPKINEDFYSRTLSGGVITIVSSTLMVFLFFSELRLFLQVDTSNEVVVDTARGEVLQINLDVTFPALACSVVSLDAMDISGELHLDVKHTIYKKRLDSSGQVLDDPKPDAINQPKIDKPLRKHGGRLEHNETYCGSCFGAETADAECCNSCEDVREAYRKKGWALTNPDLVDQAGLDFFGYMSCKHSVQVSCLPCKWFSMLLSECQMSLLYGMISSLVTAWTCHSDYLWAAALHVAVSVSS